MKRITAPPKRTGSQYLPDGRALDEANAASSRQTEAAANAQEARRDSERMDSDYGSGSDSYSRDEGRFVLSPTEPNADSVPPAMGTSDHRGLLSPESIPPAQDTHDQSDATHDRHDLDFRDDFFHTYGFAPGTTYEQYQPAYHYGNELAWSRLHETSSDWSQVEAVARQGWQSQRYGPWERFSAAVRFAWDRVHHGASLTQRSTPCP